MSKDSVAVRIAGHEYKIRSGGDDESLREIAGYVDRAMARVRERTGTVDTVDVAVLTCLNLAREILARHEEKVPSGATAVEENKLRNLIERVETSLGQPPSISGKASEARGGDSPDSAADNGDEQAEKRNLQVEVEPRTLELPPVEALRDRASARNAEASLSSSSSSSLPSSLESSAALPEKRVASGGRDRAS